MADAWEMKKIVDETGVTLVVTAGWRRTDAKI
jgi:hypothetical protein